MTENDDDLIEPQICFCSEGVMYCNYVIRNKKIIKSSGGKWLCFPAGRRKSKESEKLKIKKTRQAIKT